MTAALPTRTKMNPSAPQTADYYDIDQVAYVMVRGAGAGAAEVVFTSYGHLGADWEVGTRHDMDHDQTGHWFGIYTVKAIINFADGTRYSQPGYEIPARKLPHWVCK